MRGRGFFFLTGGLFLLLALGASDIAAYFMHRAEFLQAIIGLDNAFINNPLLVLPVYGLFVLHAAIHELAHGTTCKHYGGDVPRMGVMLYLASFIFYCDATAAWNFSDKRHRILVSLAGPIVSFAIFGLGMWAAAFFVGTGSPLEKIFVAFSMLNLFGLAMNFNPFIKMDAYYMLLDYTGIPNLRERSFKFLERKTLGWLGFGQDEDTLANDRERRVFWWYGVVGGVVTFVFMVLPLIRLNNLLKADSISNEKLLIAVLIASMVLIRLGNLAYSKIVSVRHREYKIQ